MVRDYLRGRPGLARVFLLIDARHGVKENDAAVMDMLDETAVVYQVVLTKTDKLTNAARATLVDATAETLKKRPAAHPVILGVSAHDMAGIPDLRAEIVGLLEG